MRAIRVLFFAFLAIVLILLAMANREFITVSLIPESLAPFTGGRWSLTMPAFLALFLAMVFGVLVGLVWEWLREARLRAQSRNRAQDLAQLQREVGDLRRSHAGPKDEVLAILDNSTARKGTGSGTTLPATR